MGGAAPQSLVRRRRDQPEIEAIDGASCRQAAREGALMVRRPRRMALRELNTLLLAATLRFNARA
jgi:hypothetical protein